MTLCSPSDTPLPVVRWLQGAGFCLYKALNLSHWVLRASPNRPAVPDARCPLHLKFHRLECFCRWSGQRAERAHLGQNRARTIRHRADFHSYARLGGSWVSNFPNSGLAFTGLQVITIDCTWPCAFRHPGVQAHFGGNASAGRGDWRDCHFAKIVPAPSRVSVSEPGGVVYRGRRNDTSGFRRASMNRPPILLLLPHRKFVVRDWMARLTLAVATLLLLDLRCRSSSRFSASRVNEIDWCRVARRFCRRLQPVLHPASSARFSSHLTDSYSNSYASPHSGKPSSWFQDVTQMSFSQKKSPATAAQGLECSGSRVPILRAVSC